MNPASEHPVQFFTGVLFGAAVVGLVLGLIPLAVGALTQQRSLGAKTFVITFVASLIGGAILAVPTATISSLYIIYKLKKHQRTDRNASPEA